MIAYKLKMSCTPCPLHGCNCWARLCMTMAGLACKHGRWPIIKPLALANISNRIYLTVRSLTKKRAGSAAQLNTLVAVFTLSVILIITPMFKALIDVSIYFVDIILTFRVEPFRAFLLTSATSICYLRHLDLKNSETKLISRLEYDDSFRIQVRRGLL